jgi:hypothetical protein
VLADLELGGVDAHGDTACAGSVIVTGERALAPFVQLALGSEG